LYRSAAPADPESIRVDHHARDAVAILEAENIERTAMFGWSMGVQVALEIFRRVPEKIASFVLINGVAGRPWDSVADLSVMRHVLPRAIRLVRSLPALTTEVTRRMLAWPETVTWAKRIGLAGQTLDENVWNDLAGSFADVDMNRYLHTLQLLGEHDASDMLCDVDVPTLVIAGDRDLFTPRSAAERMVHEIPGAELMIVPGGTHYVAVEQPDLVNLRIEKFFRERGYPPSPIVAAAGA
jgi:pimeloyl-ACP methyl ester carboxylesterase